MWINTSTGKVLRSHSDIRNDSANITSFPMTMTEEEIEAVGYKPIVQTAPQINSLLQDAKETAPKLIDGVWTQQWEKIDVSPEEAASRTRNMQQTIINATQMRLDLFAQTRNFDNILSATTYATSSNPKFATEGQDAVDARDGTWTVLYALMDEVAAGTREMPDNVDAVMTLLPELRWTPPVNSPAAPASVEPSEPV